jgi:hypothetical protein
VRAVVSGNLQSGEIKALNESADGCNSVESPRPKLLNNASHMTRTVIAGYQPKVSPKVPIDPDKLLRVLNSIGTHEQEAAFFGMRARALPGDRHLRDLKIEIGPLRDDGNEIDGAVELIIDRLTQRVVVDKPSREDPAIATEGCCRHQGGSSGSVLTEDAGPRCRRQVVGLVKDQKIEEIPRR